MNDGLTAGFAEVEADEEEYQRLMSLDFDSVVFGSVLAV